MIFQAKGRDWTLRLSSNALCRIEEASGVGAIEFFNQFDPQKGSFRLSNLRLALQAGIEGESLTQEQVGDLIDDMGLEAALERLMAAVEAAFPAADEKAKGGNGKGTAV